ALLASQQQRAAARAAQRSRQHPRLLRRLSTATTQLCEVPAQSYRRNLSIVNESPNGHWVWQKGALNECSDSMTSPRSISNSSLHEYDHDLSGEELA
ncbi:unnamed protein product, partial [Leptidea sinapis]